MNSLFHHNEEGHSLGAWPGLHHSWNSLTNPAKAATGHPLEDPQTVKRSSTTYFEQRVFMQACLTRTGCVKALLLLNGFPCAVVQRLSWRAVPSSAYEAWTTGSRTGTPVAPGAPASTSFFICWTSKRCQYRILAVCYTITHLQNILNKYNNS